MVTVIDAPARETAVGKIGLVAMAINLREPDDSSPTAVGGPIAGTNSLSVAQHSGGMYYGEICKRLDGSDQQCRL